MGAQIAVRMDAEELHQLDFLVRAGLFETRADALREGLRRVWADWRRQEIARAYERGYASKPQLDDDLDWVDEVGKATLAETPDG
jgi:Arc/MetJ-type ribon-helix-helix transcriptional regulator